MKNAFLTLVLATVVALPVCAQNSVDLGPNGPCPFKVDPSAPPSGPVAPSGITPPGVTPPSEGLPTSGQTSPWRASPYTPASGFALLPSGTAPDAPGIDPPKEQNPVATPVTTANPVVGEPTKTKQQLEGERLGYALAKAIVDYAIIGFGAIIGLLIGCVLMKKPKNPAGQS